MLLTLFMTKTKEAPLPQRTKQGELSELNRSDSEQEQEQGEEDEEEEESNEKKAAGVNDGRGFLTTEIFLCVPFYSTQT